MNKNVKKKIANRLSQKEIASQMKTKQQNVSRWLNGRIPAERVIPFCTLLNWEITPFELRPDLHPTPLSGIPEGVIIPLKQEGI
ncbi:transcriptional regulator [Rahnella sp. PCH160]|uniref:transcriptional regulator n=1 Tax=Rahnella sp. PCH160 TaxID=3447928 RepID=UPI0039FDD9C5